MCRPLDPDPIHSVKSFNGNPSRPTSASSLFPYDWIHENARLVKNVVAKLMLATMEGGLRWRTRERQNGIWMLHQAADDGGGDDDTGAACEASGAAQFCYFGGCYGYLYAASVASVAAPCLLL